MLLSIWLEPLGGYTHELPRGGEVLISRVGGQPLQVPLILARWAVARCTTIERRRDGATTQTVEYSDIDAALLESSNVNKSSLLTPQSTPVISHTLL